MKMKTTGRSGSGLNSRQVKHVQKGKAEPISHKGNVAGVAQQGIAAPFVKAPITQGQGYQPYGPKDHTKAGPGAMRTIYKSGSQGTHGPVNPGIPKPAPKDILSMYGPEKSKG
jgi:hypothetical protein